MISLMLLAVRYSTVHRRQERAQYRHGQQRRQRMTFHGRHRCNTPNASAHPSENGRAAHASPSTISKPRREPRSLVRILNDFYGTQDYVAIFRIHLRRACSVGVDFRHGIELLWNTNALTIVGWCQLWGRRWRRSKRWRQGQNFTILLKKEIW